MNTRHIIAIGLVVFCFWPGSVSGPSLASTKIETPSVEMLTATKDIKRIFSTANPIDRVLWTECFLRVAQIVEADDINPHVIENSLTCRAFNRATMIFLWKGIGANHPAKYPGLAEAVEKSFREFAGDEVRVLTPEDRVKLAALYRAFAYAGTGKG